MKNLFTLLLVVIIMTGTASVTNAAGSLSVSDREALIAVLQIKVLELQKLLAEAVKNSGPQLVGVTGPSAIPVGESAFWNQAPSPYPTFALGSMRWSWGDGSVPSSDNSHIYKKAGTYNAQVEGLDAKGNVVDVVKFQVMVTESKEYDIKILNFDANKDYEIGAGISVLVKTYNIPTDPAIGIWTGYMLVSEATGKEFFLGDAKSRKGGDVSLYIPGQSDYSTNGPILPGKYRLKAYLYGEGNSEYPSVLSKSFDLVVKN
jgi:hypothetical protein